MLEEGQVRVLPLLNNNNNQTYLNMLDFFWIKISICWMNPTKSALYNRPTLHLLARPWLALTEI